MTRRDALRSLALGLLQSPIRAIAADIPARTVHIEDEFGRLKAAIVHDASNAVDMDDLDLVENLLVASDRGAKHPEAGLVSRERVIKEIASFHDLLREFGVQFLRPTPLEGVPSQVFTRDPCFAVGDRLFFGSLLDDYRADEVLALSALRDRLPKPIDLASEDVLIEGGDVMVLNRGKVVLVGTNRNTNEAGFEALARPLRESGVTVHRIRHRRLHLDCCLAPLPNGSAMIASRTISKTAYPILETLFSKLIPLDPRESGHYLAANLLWLDRENVVSGIQCRKTNARLREMGYRVHILDFSTVKKMWGSFRCATCPIYRD